MNATLLVNCSLLCGQIVSPVFCGNQILMVSSLLCKNSKLSERVVKIVKIVL